MDEIHTEVSGNCIDVTSLWVVGRINMDRFRKCLSMVLSEQIEPLVNEAVTLDKLMRPENLLREASQTGKRIRDA